MKKAIVCFALVAVGAIAMFAETITASKNYVTKELELDPFSAIVAAEDFDIVYNQTSGAERVEIYAPDNIVSFISAKVEKATLKLNYSDKKLKIKGKSKIEVRVYSASVTSFRTSGSGDITIKGGIKSKESLKLSTFGSGNIEASKIECDDISLESNGSGNISLKNITCNNLTATTKGSGDIEVKNITAKEVSGSTMGSGDIKFSGSCKIANLEGKGAGDIDADDLKAKKVKAYAYGSCKITCHAEESLDADTSGNGEVSFKGNPKTMSSSTKKGVHSK